MENTRHPSPRLSRSRSGAPKILLVAPPLSPVRSMPRSSSVASSRSSCGGKVAGDCHRRPFKENRAEASGDDNAKKVVTGKTPSAWALSPGRFPPAAAKGGSGGGGRRRMDGVLGFFRQKKGLSEREEAGHNLKVMAVRLLQWRFVNAHAEAALAAQTVVKNKIFLSWLKITELRNIVAAKRILIQKRKQKLKVIKVVNPQLNLFHGWDLLAKAHFEALISLVRVLEALSHPIPLVEGSEANLVMVRKHIWSSMDVVLAIEDAIQAFYSKAENVKSLLLELVKVTKQEIEGLVELWKTTNLISSLKIYENSLRANIIQVKKQKAASIPIYEINIGLSWHYFPPKFSMLT